MKNGRKKLIKYIELKTKLIKELFDIEYTNKDDIKEVKKWTEIKCNKIYEKIKDHIMIGHVESIGTWSCPWCIANNVICSNCNYYKRHEDDERCICKVSIDPHPSRLTNKMYKNIIKIIEEN